MKFLKYILHNYIKLYQLLTDSNESHRFQNRFQKIAGVSLLAIEGLWLKHLFMFLMLAGCFDASVVYTIGANIGFHHFF